MLLFRFLVFGLDLKQWLFLGLEPDSYWPDSYWTETIPSALLVLRPLDSGWNDTFSCPGSPACQLQILEPVSLNRLGSQLLIIINFFISKSIYLYISYLFYYFRESLAQHTYTRAHTLTKAR